VNKYVQPRLYADPDVAARKIIELANGLEPYMEGRLLVERINGPFLFDLKGSPEEYKVGLERAIENAGWSCTRAGLITVHAGGRGSLCLIQTSIVTMSINEASGFADATQASRQ